MYQALVSKQATLQRHTDAKESIARARRVLYSNEDARPVALNINGFLDTLELAFDEEWVRPPSPRLP